MNLDSDDKYLNSASSIGFSKQFVDSYGNSMMMGTQTPESVIKNTDTKHADVPEFTQRFSSDAPPHFYENNVDLLGAPGLTSSYPSFLYSKAQSTKCTPSNSMHESSTRFPAEINSNSDAFYGSGSSSLFFDHGTGSYPNYSRTMALQVKCPPPELFPLSNSIRPPSEPSAVSQSSNSNSNLGTLPGYHAFLDSDQDQSFFYGYPYTQSTTTPPAPPVTGSNTSVSERPRSSNQINLEEVYQYILDLTESSKREKALLELSRRREMIPDLAPLLWHSFGVITAILQEIISIYAFLSPPNLTSVSSNRVCNALALLQTIASHQDTRQPFLNAHIPLLLYPFLNTISNARSFEYLRLTCLGVIGALVKVDDPEVIGFLLQTEIIPLCLRIMEMGSELSRTVATFIVQKILLNDLGSRYIRATAERFYALSSVLGGMVESLVKNPSSRLLKHIIKCYLRLVDNPKAKEALKRCIPPALKDGSLMESLEDDPVTQQNLATLLAIFESDSPAPKYPGESVSSSEPATKLPSPRSALQQCTPSTQQHSSSNQSPSSFNNQSTNAQTSPRSALPAFARDHGAPSSSKPNNSFPQS